jgi:hypothetical protein
VTEQPTRRLSGEEITALKFAAHRQLARWSNKPGLSPHQHAQRTALRRAAHVLHHDAVAGGCELHPRRGKPAAMPDDWRKIERGLFESADGRWRIANPWRLTTELRHRWLVAQCRADEGGWHMHDGDHATLHDARLRRASRRACGPWHDRRPLSSRPAAARPQRPTSFSTYFATTSTSRFIRAPAAAPPSVVRASVSGMSETSKPSSSIRATVSDTPSSAIEPLWTT